jgi:hypothetical protein
MGNPNQHDWAGIDLVVRTVRTGAGKPGDQGTELVVPEADLTPTFTTIKLGDTVLNETDLIALLALLN